MTYQDLTRQDVEEETTGMYWWRVLVSQYPPQRPPSQVEHQYAQSQFRANFTVSLTFHFNGQSRGKVGFIVISFCKRISGVAPAFSSAAMVVEKQLRLTPGPVFFKDQLDSPVMRMTEMFAAGRKKVTAAFNQGQQLF